jgi:hypothetical protein
MVYPRVTELDVNLEPLSPDPFITDLGATGTGIPLPPAPPREAARRAAGRRRRRGAEARRLRHVNVA